MEFLTRILFVAAMLCIGWLSYTMDKQADEHRAALELVQREKAQALAALRQRETETTQRLEKINEETQAKLEAVQRSATTAHRAADGLRQQLTSFASRGNAPGAATASECAAERGRVDLLAQLLGELDGMAGEYATAADESKRRGLACELSYKAINP